jgi:arginine metabolism regulation protein II
MNLTKLQVFNGDMQDAHKYLAESEDLIRTFGLPKRIKSPKVSKLHHIFSYLRIIQESTSVIWMNVPNEVQHLRSIPKEHLQCSQMWVEDEEPEDAEENSLFVSIYQLPTTLLSLLSQTSSLCKQLQQGQSLSPEFPRRCQVVEDRIFKWKAPQTLAFSDTWDTPSNPSAHIVAATYLALIVHFQRQIRNTDPRVLQHYVLRAADHLLAHEQLKSTLQMAMAPFPWPCFIVGCESYENNARQKIDRYLETVRSYNLGNLVETEKVIHEVWRRQDLGRSDQRWDDVLRDWKMRIVLT